MKKSILRITLGTVAILLIPLIAMQFTEDVQWGLSDFVIIGTLLFSAGLSYEVIAQRMRQKEHRIVFGIVVVVAVLWLWAELAVGIFTNWGS